MSDKIKTAGSERKEPSGLILKKDSLLRLLVLAGIVGVALIFFSSVFRKPDAPAQNGENLNTAEEAFSADEYRSQLCQELGNMIASIRGAGKTKLMLTLDGTVRTLYASDNDIQQKESSRKNSSDENADKQSSEKKSLITVRGKDGTEQAVRIGQLLPSVRGVLVVCEGGDDENVRRRITEAVEAALNISSSRICVTKGDL